MSIMSNFPASGAAGGGMSLVHTLEMVRYLKMVDRLLN